MKPIKLNNWSIVSYHDPYLAPELVTKHLRGCGVNHPKFGNQEIRTSPIKTVKGRLVITQSGTQYLLGNIDPEYRKWIEKHYMNWNWRNPIKSMEELPNVA